MTLRDHVGERGRLSALSRSLGVSHSTVLRWLEGRVPAERVRAVSQATSIPAHVLRPDLYDAPPHGGPRADVLMAPHDAEAAP